MAESIKFTQDEMNAIAQLQQRFDQVTFKCGALFIERERLNTQLTRNAVEFDKAKKELDGLDEEQTKLGATLRTKYGDGELNQSTGVFTPASKP